MGKRIIVLGTGLVGKAIAIDLKRSGYDVTAADLDEGVLEELERDHEISAIRTDFTGDHLIGLVTGFDLVVGASPGATGYGIMERVIRAGRNMVDISFCPEDFMELNPMAMGKGVTLVTDMGVAPGLCNAILGYHSERMEVESYRCLVGGLPFRREWPLEYKSSWSPIDCLEEYIRPARFRRNGKEVVMPALSEQEEVEFERVGKLEAWNSDGLRSLLHSFPEIPDMVEKTLRYPGTTEYLRALRELGYFSKNTVEVAGMHVKPIDLTAALLIPRFRMEEGERDFTVMRVTIDGRENGVKKRYRYELYDEYDSGTGILSMARTTGYTCTGVAGLILGGSLTRKGVIPPEGVAVEEAHFRQLMQHLAERKIRLRVNGSPVS